MDDGRRRFLGALGGAAITGVAGCAGYLGNSTTTDSRTSNDAPIELDAVDGDPDDGFGVAVDLAADGSTAVVGASADDDPNGDGSGTAYVLERRNDAWRQRAKLAPENGAAGDHLGYSLAMSADGTTAIVGAFGRTEPNGVDSGSAYVFDRSSGEWTETAMLLPEDGDAEDFFGTSVGLSADGTTAVVGASDDEDPNGEKAGSAYVFEQSNGDWTQRTKLLPDDGDAEDYFGWSAALSNDGSTAIVGASDDEDPNGEKAGSAYVFEQSDGDWEQRAKLAADDGGFEEYFGVSVALNDDATTAVVSAVGQEVRGAVYVFDTDGDSWEQQAKIQAADGDSGDRFGDSLGVSNDGSTLVVGAVYDDDPNGERAGSTYRFERAGDAWNRTEKFAPETGDAGDMFGEDVSVDGDGDTVLVGASERDGPNGEAAGSVYVFE